jgi:hypothetical protein
MTELEDSNAALRDAVATRIQNAGKPSEDWYKEGERIVAVGELRKERPGSLAFMEVLEELRATHLKKSQDYGDPADALANIRSGASLVGVEPWRGCLIRVADKIQRIKSFCRDGSLANEGFEDALLDLASYAVIALVMFREEQNK